MHKYNCILMSSALGLLAVGCREVPQSIEIPFVAQSTEALSDDKSSQAKEESLHSDSRKASPETDVKVDTAVAAENSDAVRMRLNTELADYFSRSELIGSLLEAVENRENQHGEKLMAVSDGKKYSNIFTPSRQTGSLVLVKLSYVERMKARGIVQEIE